MGIASNQPPRAWWSGFRDHWPGFCVRKGAAGTIWRGLSLYEGPDFGNIIKSSSNNLATHFNDAMEPVLFLHIKWPIRAYKSISDLCIMFTSAAFLGQHTVREQHIALLGKLSNTARCSRRTCGCFCWTVQDITEQWACFREVKESLTGSHSEVVGESKQW